MRLNLVWRWGKVALLIFLLISCKPLANTPLGLTVSAAASLQKVMIDVQGLYNTIQPNVKIIYNFAASGSLQQQIEQGADVDVFISASTQQMDALADKGLILSDTRKNLLTNQIVLVVPNSFQGMTSFQDLTRNRITKIALGEPKSVPIGKYAQEVLNYFKIFSKVKNKIIFAKDARQVLSYVETANVDVGIVYLTDAKLSNLVKIAATAPIASHSSVVYPVAVVQNSKKTSIAKDFVQFIASQEAIKIYKKYGFSKAS